LHGQNVSTKTFEINSCEIGAIKEIDAKIEKQKRRLEDEKIPYIFTWVHNQIWKRKEENRGRIAEKFKGGVEPWIMCSICSELFHQTCSHMEFCRLYGSAKASVLVFPEGILYNRVEDKYRTDNINPVFSYIAELERFLGNVKAALL
jgi:hypothetical protein